MSPRRSTPRLEPYASSVPAVQRTMGVLEELARHPAGLPLAELGRCVGVSPSSLLAILRTLERGGYVAQQPDSRRYVLGLPLVALARRAGRGLVPEALFLALAGPVAERLGQTVSLWALHGT